MFDLRRMSDLVSMVKLPMERQLESVVGMRKSKNRNPFARSWLALAAGVLMAPAAFGQSLSLGSGEGSPGETVQLSLTLSGVSWNTGPASIEFELDFNPNDFTNLTVNPGPAATAADKVGSCVTTNGESKCLLYGFNSKPVQNGVVAVISVGLSSSSNLQRAIGIAYALGANADGNSAPLASTGGSISVTPRSGSIPQSVRVTPSNGTGSRQAFQFLSRDTDGANNIAYVQMRASTSGSDFKNACLIHHNPDSNEFYLLSDSGAQWSKLVGGSGQIRNGQCVVYGAGSSSVKSGDTLLTTIDVAFRSGFEGVKNLGQLTNDREGNGSGWRRVGSWNVVLQSATNSMEAVSVEPSEGSGAKKLFEVTYQDGDGAGDIKWAQFNVTSALSYTNACLIHHDQSVNKYYLLSDDATRWQVVAGGTGSKVENSQCILRGAGTGEVVDGDKLIVSYDLEFKAGFGGRKQVNVRGLDRQGNDLDWAQLGEWNVVTDTGSLQAVSITPNGGSGAGKLFAATFRDGDGANDIRWEQINFSEELSYGNACLIHHDPDNNVFYLLNDSATGWSTLDGGSSDSVENSQCILKGRRSGQDLDGDELTVKYDIKFKPGFAGPKKIHLRGSDREGNRLTWEQIGTWTATN